MNSFELGLDCDFQLVNDEKDIYFYDFEVQILVIIF